MSQIKNQEQLILGVILNMPKHIYKSERNIPVDNFFSRRLKKNITLVGTVRSTRREINTIENLQS